MEYQVWTRETYDERWDRENCGDLGAAKRAILIASKGGLIVELTVLVPFEVQLKVGEPGAEVKKPPAKLKKSPGETVIEEVESEADQSKSNSD